MKTVPLLLVGNFLSHALRTRSVCEDLAEHLKNSGWPVITTSSKLRRSSRLMDMLSTIWTKRDQYEVAQVDVYSGKAFLWSELACWTLRKAGKPYALTLHGGNLSEFSRKHPQRVKRLLKSAAVVTSPSSYLIENMRHFSADVILLPNPIDLKAFPFSLRKNPRPKLVWLRAFHKIYNPKIAAEVVALLAEDFPDIQLIMGGPDKDRRALREFKQTAEKLNILRHIEISGAIQRDQIGTFLNRGDIFVNTTLIDNTPVSVMEAMGCGLCVVSTDVGGIPKLVADGHDALLVPPHNAKAMSEAVHRILIDHELAARLSMNGRNKIESFDWAHILPKWQSLFLSLYKHGRNQTEWKVKNASISK